MRTTGRSSSPVVPSSIQRSLGRATFGPQKLPIDVFFVPESLLGRAVRHTQIYDGVLSVGSQLKSGGGHGVLLHRCTPKDGEQSCSFRFNPRWCLAGRPLEGEPLGHGAG